MYIPIIITGIKCICCIQEHVRTYKGHMYVRTCAEYMYVCTWLPLLSLSHDMLCLACLLHFYIHFLGILLVKVWSRTLMKCLGVNTNGHDDISSIHLSHLKSSYNTVKDIPL